MSVADTDMEVANNFGIRKALQVAQLSLLPTSVGPVVPVVQGVELAMKRDGSGCVGAQLLMEVMIKELSLVG